jgi:hypothetical protein
MKFKNQTLHASVAMVALLTGLTAGPVEVKVTPEMREYCHIIQFSRGWGKISALTEHEFPPIFSYDSEYEFRVSGMEPRFVVRGRDPVTKNYTANTYEVDLSDQKSVPRLTTEEKWQAGTPVRFTKKEAFALAHPGKESLYTLQVPPSGFTFHGIQFDKTGPKWASFESRLSPGELWIVLQSRSGTVAHSEDVPLGRVFGRDGGKLFFDVYNADTGKRAFTIPGTYNGIDPNHALSKTGWLTERYFIVPLGQRERCLVCEFGAKRKIEGAKP